YAACGDLHRSEDIAQETFISAWKSLSGLRDAAKLPAWLCEIARHRMMDQSRKSAREREGMLRAFNNPEHKVPTQPPDDLLADEERELLWKTLSQIPQPYRETLVLYYRQGQSTAD